MNKKPVLRSHGMIDGAAACAAVVLTGLVYAAVVSPRLSAAGVYCDRLAVLDEQTEAAERLEQDLRESRQALAEARGSAEQQTVRLARADEINARLAAMMQLAEEMRLGKVKIEQVQPGAPGREGQFAVVPIRLAGEASYVACAEFVAALHERMKDTALVGLTLAAESGAPGAAARGRFTIELSWYALPSTGGRVADAAREGRN